MAKTKKAESATQKAATAARIAFAATKDKLDKADNQANKDAFAKAKAARDVAVKAENRERFLNVGTNRTKKARAAIRQLVKVASPKTYDFTADEGIKIVTGLLACVKEVENAFKAATATGATAAPTDDFSL